MRYPVCLYAFLVSVVCGNAAPPSSNTKLERQCWEILNGGAKEGNPEKRIGALAALASLGPLPEAVSLVEKGLHDEDASVRRTAAEALGSMGACTSVHALRGALDDTEEVGFAAARSLWQLGDLGGETIFWEILTGERKDAPGMFQGMVRDAKRQMRSPGKLAMMAVKNVSGTFLGPGAMGVTLAENALKDQGAAGRIIAVCMLENDPHKEALAVLEWALADNNPAVRAAVCRALGHRGNRATIDKLKSLAEDSKEKDPVRYMAAAAILRLSAARRLAGKSQGCGHLPCAPGNCVSSPRAGRTRVKAAGTK